MMDKVDGPVMEKQEDQIDIKGLSISETISNNECPDQPQPPQPQYQPITQNIIHFDDAKRRESRALRCDCKPCAKDRKEGRACGSECINRLLFMECYGKCPSGKYCTNRKFQNQEYADLEMFFTGPKGWGLKAKSDIQKGQFIIEYMGEVVDSREVTRRIRIYGKDAQHKHHYLMALQSGCVIDATRCGNLSRFINHSCNPNAATQKWTVGNEVRIGFFALRTIKVGEEVVFDYQFERYGRQAQECYCKSENCTGYIGAKSVDDEDEDDEGEYSGASTSGDELLPLPVIRAGPVKKKVADEQKRKQVAKRASTKGTRTRQKKKDELKLVELDEVSEILAKGTLRNRDHVLEFNRVMVRVDQMGSRQKMVDFLLKVQDPDILRLFVANQGLALIRIWFMVPKFTIPSLRLQTNIAKLLFRLPVAYKNQVLEARIMDTLDEILRLEPPTGLVVQDVVEDIVTSVVQSINGENGDERRINPIMLEFESLKSHVERLAGKWEKLIEYHYRIPKKNQVKKMVKEEQKVLEEEPENNLNEVEEQNHEHQYLIRKGHQNNHIGINNRPRTNGFIKASRKFFHRENNDDDAFYNNRQSSFDFEPRYNHRRRNLHSRRYLRREFSWQGRGPPRPYERRRREMMDEIDEPLEGPDDRYYYQNDRLLPPAPCLPLPGPSHRRPVPLMRIHTDYNHDPYDYDLYDNCQNPTGFMPQMYGPRPPFCPVPERPIQFVDGLQGLPGPMPPPPPPPPQSLPPMPTPAPPQPVPPPNIDSSVLWYAERLQAIKEAAAKSNAKLILDKLDDKKQNDGKLKGNNRDDAIATIGVESFAISDNEDEDIANEIKRSKKAAKKKLGRKGIHKRYFSRAAIIRRNRERFLEKYEALASRRSDELTDEHRSRSPSISRTRSRTTQSRSRSKTPPSRPVSRSTREEKEFFKKSSKERESRRTERRESPSNRDRGKDRTRYPSISPAREGWDSSLFPSWRAKRNKRGGRMNKRGGRGRGRVGSGSRFGDGQRGSVWPDAKVHHGRPNERSEEKAKKSGKKKSKKRNRSQSSSTAKQKSHKGKPKSESKHHRKLRSPSSSSTTSNSSSSSRTSCSSCSSTSTSNSSKTSKSSLSTKEKKKKKKRQRIHVHSHSLKESPPKLKTKNKKKHKLKSHATSEKAKHLSATPHSSSSKNVQKSESVTSTLKFNRPPIPIVLLQKMNTETSKDSSRPVEKTPSVVKAIVASPGLQPPQLTQSILTNEQAFDSYVLSLQQFLNDLRDVKRELFQSNNEEFLANKMNVKEEALNIKPIKREIASDRDHKLAENRENGPPRKKHRPSDDIVNNTPPEDPRIMARPNRKKNATENAGNETPNIQPSSSTNHLVNSQQSFTQNDKTCTNAHMDAPLVISNTVAKGRATSTVSQQQHSILTPSPEKSMVTKNVKLEPSENDTKQQQQQTTANSGGKQISKSGNWLEAKDSDGATYYYHRITRESAWELPEHEKIDECDEEKAQQTKTKRMQFKQSVFNIAQKMIEPYRRRFFSSHVECQHFLRRIMHSVLERQDKVGNNELDFDDSVCKYTRRLVEDYIRHVKTRSVTQTGVPVSTSSNSGGQVKNKQQPSTSISSAATDGVPNSSTKH